MPNRFSESWDACPREYVEFLEAHGNWEGDLGEDKDYVVLWDKAGIQESYEAYVFEEFLDPRWFPIGSNGGGEMLCIDLDSKNHSVYWLPFIGMSDEEPILKYQSLRDLIKSIEDNT